MRRLLSRFLEWLPAAAYRLDRKSLRNPLATDLGCSAILIACLALFVLGLGAVIAHCEEVMPSVGYDGSESDVSPAVAGGGASGENTPAVPDPQAVQPLAQVWLGGESTYAANSAQKYTPVGQISLIAGMGRWGGGLRVRTMGVSGVYQPNQPSTFTAAEAYALLFLNVADTSRTGYTITIAPAIFAGYAVPLQTQNGVSPTLARTCTAMVGLRLAGPSWRAEIGAGMYQQLSGFAVGATTHAQLTDHSAWVVDAAVGSAGKYVASIALLLRP